MQLVVLPAVHNRGSKPHYKEHTVTTAIQNMENRLAESQDNSIEFSKRTVCDLITILRQYKEVLHV